MWSNVISIDKSESEKFDRLLREVEKVKELSSAVEESKNRNYIYFAGLCEYADLVRDKIENIVTDVLLTDYKLGFYFKKLNYREITHAVAALLSTLVYLDYDLERAFVTSVLRNVSSYDVDGIFYFRLRTLRAGWQEVADMCNRLFEIGTDEGDIFNVISYIGATKAVKPVELTLFCGERSLINDLSDEEIKIRTVFNDYGFDLINAVISASATKLTVENNNLDKDTLRALKHIVRLKVK